MKKLIHIPTVILTMALVVAASGCRSSGLHQTNMLATPVASVTAPDSMNDLDRNASASAATPAYALAAKPTSASQPTTQASFTLPDAVAPANKASVDPFSLPAGVPTIKSPATSVPVSMPTHATTSSSSPLTPSKKTLSRAGGSAAVAAGEGKLLPDRQVVDSNAFPDRSSQNSRNESEDGLKTVSHSASPTTRLIVNGVLPQQGPVMVAVFDTAVEFPHRDAAKLTKQLDANEVTLTVKLPLSGTIAVAAFQDLDGNGVVTRGRFGIPLEPFAFSNDATAKRGPPSFADAAVTTGADQPATVTINLSQLR